MSELKTKTLQSRMGFRDNDLKHPDHDALMSKFLDKDWLTKLLENFFPNAHDIEVENVILERPVKSSNGFIIGFIDAVVGFKYGPIKISESEEWKAGQKTIKKCEFRDSFTLYVEIKAKEKPTAGEVLRQIRTYTEAVGKSRWALVTIGEFNGKEILNHEKIGVVEVEPDLKSFRIFR